MARLLHDVYVPQIAKNLERFSMDYYIQKARKTAIDVITDRAKRFGRHCGSRNLRFFNFIFEFRQNPSNHSHLIVSNISTFKYSSRLVHSIQKILGNLPIHARANTSLLIFS